MKKFTLISLCALACVGGVALANDPHPVTTPGWMYGRGKCARWSIPPVLTRLACEQCCHNAAASGAIPENELDNCLAFCALHWANA
jgi:hypothetical protein